MNVNNLCQVVLKIPLPQMNVNNLGYNAAVIGRLAYNIQNGKKTLSGWHNSRNLGSHDSRGEKVRHEQ